MNIFNINLENFIDKRLTALVGRPNGEKLLENFKKNGIILSEKEAQFDQICITIPQFIVTINKSYFLGWFETRIQLLGKERFQKIYKFQTTEHVEKKFDEFIDAALLNASQEDILNMTKDIK